MPKPAKSRAVKKPASRAAKKPAARASKKTVSRAQAPGDYPAWFLGQIQPYAFGFAPNGWAICQGELLPISRFPGLYSLLGTNYGGDGITTFGLPNLSPMEPSGPTYYIAITGTYPQRN
jgi:hypothetical protein